jgi:hypothetical protein
MMHWADEIKCVDLTPGSMAFFLFLVSETMT